MYHDWTDWDGIEWDNENQTWKVVDDEDEENRDMDEADELSTQLYILNRKEASDYLDGPARKLDSFDGSKNQLLDVMLWSETEQGYGYWEEIFHELLSCGWEERNRKELEGIEL